MPFVTLGLCPVPYSVLLNEPAEITGDAQSGYTASLSFKISGGFSGGSTLSDVTRFVQFAGGQAYSITVGTSTVSRYIPLSHPDYPYLLCMGIDAKAAGSMDVTGHRAWYRVKLTFKSVPYGTDGSAPFLTKETKTSANIYTLAGTSLTFSDGTPIQADAGITVPEIAYSLTIYQGLTLGDDVAAPLVGKINSTPFLNWPPYMVRFDGQDGSLIQGSTGTPTYTRKLTCVYRPIDWRYFLRKDGVWDLAQKPDSSYVYDAVDLNPLLQ